MQRTSRSIVCYALAILISLAGIVVSPDTVLCVGPGNDCHLETVVGDSCNQQLPVPENSAPIPRDGCPKGSKDVRLRVDSNRSNKTSFLAVFPPVLTVVTGVVVLARLFLEQPDLARFPRGGEARIFTIVLR